MSSRSTRKSAAMVEVESSDELEVVMATVAEVPTLQEATLDSESPESAVDSTFADDPTIETPSPESDTAATDNNEPDTSLISAPATTAEALSTQLDQLIRSVGIVEELSRRAREAAADDLTRYDALLASCEQYIQGREQACAIRDQACQVQERAFGQQARAAAEPLVSHAERVLQAFADLDAIWQEQASAFLLEHQDVELLLAERRVEEEEARRREAAAACAHQLNTLIDRAFSVLQGGLVSEGKRLPAALERQFPDQTDAIDQLRRQLQLCVRAEKDAAARQALAASAEHQARGDLEAAVSALEAIDVHELSRDLSEHVFGRWSDTCSRLAQTGGATLLRFAPTQGRGLILTCDPLYPNGLVVFSSLGMGPMFPQGKVVTDLAILRRAHPFREATQLPTSSWLPLPASAGADAPRSPVHH
jgi:hypothetical protein